MKKQIARKAIFTTALVFTTGYSVQAAIIYTDAPSVAANDSLANSVGWISYDNLGTDYSNSSSGLMLVQNSGTSDFAFIGSSGVNGNQLRQYYIGVDASPVILDDYSNDLMVAFAQSATDTNVDDSGTMGWRVLAQLGGVWYASDFIGFTASTETMSVTFSDNVWHAWESDLTDGFNLAGISGSTTSLTSGTITSFGILAIDGSDSNGGNNDRMRLFDYTISGTAIPEPSLAALMCLGGLALARRRVRS